MSAGSRRRRVGASRPQPTVVGFVCEGSTDVAVLKRVVEQVLGNVEARVLQPEVDALDRQPPGSRGGWSEVRAWCQRVESFDDYFAPFVGDPLDALVIALDLDCAISAGLTKRPENLDAYDAAGLCRMIKSWLRGPIPREVIIAIPVMAIEAWVLAALYPRSQRPEAVPDPARVLVARGRIPNGSNGPWKRVLEYREFAGRVASVLSRVRGLCPEANRFAEKLQQLSATSHQAP